MKDEWDGKSIRVAVVPKGDNRCITLKGEIEDPNIKAEVEGCMTQVPMKLVEQCLLILGTGAQTIGAVICCPATYWECEKEINRQCAKQQQAEAKLKLFKVKSECPPDKRTIVYFGYQIYMIANAAWFEAENTNPS
jgi:hypothetical protein